LVAETLVDINRSEFLSFLFQLEIFEEIPGVGLASGAFLNFTFMRRVNVTARRVFQEGWLKENGKVQAIAPATEVPAGVVNGMAAVAGRAAGGVCYGAGFAAALPVFAVASLVNGPSRQPHPGIPPAQIRGENLKRAPFEPRAGRLRARLMHAALRDTQQQALRLLDADARALLDHGNGSFAP
jgi:hypothetical protein